MFLKSRAAMTLVTGVSLAVACTSPPTSDLETERRALLAADSLFLVEVEQRGADGWADFFLAEGVQFPGSGRVDGRDEIRELMGEAFAPGMPRLVWAPTEAQVGSGGDLGYTLGRWQSIGIDAAGSDVLLGEGHYVTIWRKTSDGTWRVAVDIGNTDAE
jgi:ketosteroid isomerase-like protein